MADEKSLDKSVAAARSIKTGKGLTPSKSAANVAAGLSPAAHRQATQQAKVTDEFEHDTAFHMAFLGTGQGGGRIANSFWSLGYRRVGVFNTTDQDFDGL